MIKFILIFIFIFINSFAQKSNDNNYFNGLEIGNLGSPFLSFFPNFSQKNLELSPDFMGNTLLEKKIFSSLNHIFFSSDTVIKNGLKYIGVYSDGGFISSQLNRPISDNSYINFNYENLSSKGYFQFQENKFSNLSFQYSYFDKKIPYALIFHLKSVNNFSLENGGIEDYNQNLSDDLQQTYFFNANSEMRSRVFSFLHYYKFKSGRMISHEIDYNRYKKVFVDNTANSFHYSFTPLFFAILENYSNTMSFYQLKNKLTFHSNYFSGKNIDFSIKLVEYYHDFISDYRGDFIISVSNFKNIIDSKYNFDLKFCPFGLNKNNYDFKLLYSYNNNDFNGKYLFGLNKKKADLFSGIYSPNNLTNLSWEDDISFLKNIYASIDNTIKSRKINFNFNYRRIHNLIYYDYYALYNQLEKPVDYFHFLIQKKWFLKNLRIEQCFHFQKEYFENQDESNFFSIPFFLFHQSIKYNLDLFEETKLRIDLNFKIHSNYFPNTYMPLSSIFYNQNEIELGWVPYFSSSIYLEKTNFSLGLIFREIQYAFLERNYLTKDYIANPSSFSLFINWRFFD